MINDEDTTRAEKIDIEIEEIDKDIDRLQIVIQKVSEVKNDFFDFGLRDEFFNVVDNCDKQIKYLEDKRIDNEVVLKNLNMSEDLE